jgi:endonuclease YncB( thermonuclease family)
MFTRVKLPTIMISCLVTCTVLYPSICAAKSIYGQMTAITSPNLMTLDYGAGTYTIRVANIDVPTNEPYASAARQFVTNLVLGKNVRLRFISRAPNGEMLGRLDTDDPAIGIKDVGVELVRAGLARVQPGFGGDLAKAENEARQAGRGLWAAAQPQ